MACRVPRAICFGAYTRQTRIRTNELSFWSFGVAVLLFSLGAGIAIYDGVAKLADPLPNKYLQIAYAVLAATFIALVVITRLALKQLTLAGPRTSGTARACARTGRQHGCHRKPRRPPRRGDRSRRHRHCGRAVGAHGGRLCGDRDRSAAGRRRGVHVA